MNGSSLHFASFVGVVGADLAMLPDSAAWRACIDRSASRCPAAPAVHVRPRAAVAYRGDARGFHRDGSCMVLLDGVVENLRMLVAEAVREVADECPSGDAAQIARLYARYGDALWELLVGSFSLAIVHPEAGEVTLVRDRFGAHPLFFARCGTGIAFASEIKNLTPLLGPLELDAEGLRQAIHYRFVIGETLLRGVRQLLPACYVHLGPDRIGAETRHFRLDFSPTSAEEGLDAWVDRTDAALDAYMQRLKQRHSSIGILLSGGVDSSLLALKARQAGFANCVALTARWPGENPELDLAIAIAKHIGIEHHVVDVDESRFEAFLPWIVWRLDELPRHFNSLVLACLFEHGSTRFDTLLHGHSADVMFGASETISIRKFNQRNHIFSAMPGLLRRFLASQLPRNDSPRMRRLRQYLELDEHGYLKSQFAIEYGRASAPIKDLHFRPRGPSRHVLEHFYEAGDPTVERMQRLDTYWFNQSHLAVLDRLGAPLGMPIGKPFLSPEVLQVARVLPSEFKAIGNEAKPVLKRLMARSFPAEWVYRKKQGFPTQTSRWLNQPLLRWRRMLSEERTRDRALLSLRSRRKADVDPYYESVWSSISLELFCRQFLDGEGGPSTPAR